ncbi:MAG: geranylgeranyl diphosphate reductase [Roseitalea sp.]|jgi:geranylgeranyl reductase|nr:geranylgeranyl diphosphate reductase [Roseitalea sp.]MBO6952362.1 geranylgeranyl diphosphate reductase [Rhizobiaceae bacterium]RNC90626.1 MAG: geranylgeranyl diphosphate reductase [Oricola sp.]MBO6591792.1 geranylgeranyl diphosphate reductase [Roseitalea sp.]MBO6598047.1 geranylgeranyl diphosphate reductase [Roseitalea sp.]
MSDHIHDVIVIGGGPGGATAAHDLAVQGHDVVLVDKEGRIKPCGGAIPTKAISEFAIPQEQLVSKAHAARIIAPSGKSVDMTIGNIGYVGMVDRDKFDPWLRERARQAGADYIVGSFKGLDQNADGTVTAHIADKADKSKTHRITARMLIGADGANSAVRRTAFDKARQPPYVFAYHEIVKSPATPDPAKFRADRCDVIYDGRISPDFYGWVFPHGNHTSVGTGSAVKGHSLKEATRKLREDAGLADCETVREEGAPLPLKPMRRWDNGKNIVLAGDAAGVVAPSSGEGIYYAMLTGRLCADAALEAIATQRATALKSARKRFMKDHGKVFFVLGMMQYFWYSSDKRREKFVTMCADPDVQRLTWEGYLNKKLVRRDPLAHLKIMVKDTAQLLGFARTT